MKKTAVLLAFAGLSLAGAADATTITFSEADATQNAFFSDDGRIKAEYVWSTGLADGHSHLISVAGNRFERGHGQSWQGLRFSLVGGGALTLESFDFQGTWTVGGLNDGAGAVYDTGFGSWTTQAVNWTHGGPIYIYANGEFNGGYLDNVVFDTAAEVPEPAGAALMLLGMAGLAAIRRRAGK